MRQTEICRTSNLKLGILDMLAFKQEVPSTGPPEWTFPLTRAEHESDAILEP